MIKKRGNLGKWDGFEVKRKGMCLVVLHEIWGHRNFLINVKKMKGEAVRAWKGSKKNREEEIFRRSKLYLQHVLNVNYSLPLYAPFVLSLSTLVRTVRSYTLYPCLYCTFSHSPPRSYLSYTLYPCSYCTFS